MSEPETAVVGRATPSPGAQPPSARPTRSSDRDGGGIAHLLRTAAGRNLGLVVALVLLCIVGVVTAGDRFADVNNVLTILRLAAVIGVVSVGLTFVITGGGIDLSVGAIVALSSVWCTTLATQTVANDSTWLVMVFAALAVGAGCGVVNGVLVAYGKIVPFIATLAMLAGARGLAEIISNRRTQIVNVPAFVDVLDADVLGIPVLVILFALVAAARLGRAQPDHLRPPHRRRRRQPGGGPARRHPRPAAHHVPLRAARPVLRRRRADAGRPDHDRQLDARHPVRARRHRGRRHRRHPALRAAAGPSSAPSSAC